MTSLFTVREAVGVRDVEVRVGGLRRDLGDRAVALLEEAWRRRVPR